MTISQTQCSEISAHLLSVIRNKLVNYNPETNNMPFHVRLLGQDRMALFSFIHSINTVIGTSVFEQVAVIMAQPRFSRVQMHYTIGTQESQRAQGVIGQIMNRLEASVRDPNKLNEINEIMEVAQIPPFDKVKKTMVDLFVESCDGCEYYFDLKTAKPNKGDFTEFKRTMLDWVAIRGAQNNKVHIKTMIAIPYNPYEPKQYQRWTLKGLFDLEEEIMVAAEFWDFLGGEGAYDQLLDVFEQVGMILRPEIDQRFSGFRS